MLGLSLAGEQEEPRERARTSVDERATRLHEMMQAEHVSDCRNGKLEKDR